MKPDLNIDVGEHPDEPDELYVLAHRVSIACGGHTGDEDSMRRAVELAKAAKIQIGAHPSFPDRPGFGRRHLTYPEDELRASLEDQCDALNAVSDELPVNHVKPHGALYHAANTDPQLARMLVESVVATLNATTIIGPPQGELRKAAKAAGCPFLAEGFADRTYAADGTLVPRDAEGALIDDPAIAAAQAVRLAKTGLYDTLCVHSDTPNAVALARAVRAALDAL